MNLEDAIACLKANGYRVTKPGTRRSKTKDRVGPTFVAIFADGAKTRMSCCCSDEKPDWARGEALARAAYASRNRFSFNLDLAVACPAIAASWFERDGVRI